MHQAGLRGVSRRKGARTTIRRPAAQPAPDLVQRDFTLEGPNRLWTADMTYIPTWAGFLFPAVVIDAHRRVVGWAMATHLKTELVPDVLQMALDQRSPPDVIHHSDRGCQYTSIAVGKRCEAFGMRPSMESVGDCYDNALTESFFATPCELIDRRSLCTTAEAQVVVFEFIEACYNRQRRHSALSYLSPVDFERQAVQNDRPPAAPASIQLPGHAILDQGTCPVHTEACTGVALSNR